jgi:hypothetical protein
LRREKAGAVFQNGRGRREQLFSFEPRHLAARKVLKPPGRMPAARSPLPGLLFQQLFQGGE